MRTPRDDWQPDEVRAIVTDYLKMLICELQGSSYNKSEHRRRLMSSKIRRSPGAIERKHQNISAVLEDLGFPYIRGYKPLGNYQGMLRGAVERRVKGDTRLAAAIASAARQGGNGRR